MQNQSQAFNPTVMLNITQQLANILAQEVALLKDMKIAEVYKLYDDKIALTEALEGYKQLLAENPEMVASIPAHTMEQIRQQAKDFEQLIAEDKKQIERASQTHKVIMEAVRKTVERKVVMRSGYTKQGVISTGQKYFHELPPVAVNENI